MERAKNRTKSQVRCKVEHVFGVMKLKFGFSKARTAEERQSTVLPPVRWWNLFMVRKKLLGAVAL